MILFDRPSHDALRPPECHYTHTVLLYILLRLVTINCDNESCLSNEFQTIVVQRSLDLADESSTDLIVDIITD